MISKLFLSDPEAKFSKSLGWNMGERTARYAIVLDHGKVTYAEREPGRDVTVRKFLGMGISNPTNQFILGFKRSTCAFKIVKRFTMSTRQERVN